MSDEAPANGEAIQMVAALLADIEAGNVTEVAYAALRRDGTAVTAATSAKQSVALVGALEIVKLRIVGNVLPGDLMKEPADG